jgi:hypothetical protein
MSDQPLFKRFDMIRGSNYNAAVTGIDASPDIPRQGLHENIIVLIDLYNVIIWGDFTPKNISFTQLPPMFLEKIFHTQKRNLLDHLEGSKKLLKYNSAPQITSLNCK